MKHTLTLLLLLATVFVQAQIPTVKELLDEATKKEGEKDYTAALAYYEQALRLEPRNGAIYNQRSFYFISVENYREAKADLDRAILLSPKKALYYINRAMMFNNIGYYEYTIKDADKGLEYAESNDEKSLAHYLRAEAKSHTGKKESALDDYNASIANNPQPGTEMAALLASASVLGELKRGPEAIATLETLIAKYPQFTAAYNNLGFQLIEEKQYKKAVQTFDKLIKIIELRGDKDYETENTEVQTDGVELAAPLNNRGYAKFMLGDKKEALKDINASIKIDPANPYAYKNRALVYLANKKDKDACADLQKAIDLGFTKAYGNEAQELLNEHCKK